MCRGEIPCRIAIPKCWFSSMLNRVPEKHAAGNLMFTLFRFKFLTIRKSGSEHSFSQNNPLAIRQSEIGCFEVATIT